MFGLKDAFCLCLFGWQGSVGVTHDNLHISLT